MLAALPEPTEELTVLAVVASQVHLDPADYPGPESKAVWDRSLHGAVGRDAFELKRVGSKPTTAKVRSGATFPYSQGMLLEGYGPVPGSLRKHMRAVLWSCARWASIYAMAIELMGKV